MREATIRFEGESFHWAKWNQLLTDSGFRVSGTSREKAIYASRGNTIRAESKGFVTRDQHQGYEWQVRLEQTQRWEGTIKFYSVLLSAFSMPQVAIVAFGDCAFSDREALREHAENAMIEEFSLDELRDNGIYQQGAGLRFG